MSLLFQTAQLLWTPLTSWSIIFVVATIPPIPASAAAIFPGACNEVKGSDVVRISTKFVGVPAAAGIFFA